MPRLARRCAVLVALLLTAPEARAHGVVVDGDASEWFTASPAGANRAIVVRSAAGGELVWWDASGDERTDFGATGEADLTRLQVTGDATGLSVLVRRTGTAALSGDGAFQVQVAVDVDGVPGSGGTTFAGLADTGVAATAAWERLVATRFGSGSPPWVFTPSFTDVGGAVAAIAGDTVELRVAWTALGLPGPPTTPLRLTVATFRTGASDATWDIVGTSNALDAVTDYGLPGTVLMTWSEVGDGVVDFALETWFDPWGDVYDPLAGEPCADDADCGDGDLCNGVEVCGADRMCDAGAPLVCDDGAFCNGTET